MGVSQEASGGWTGAEIAPKKCAAGVLWDRSRGRMMASITPIVEKSGGFVNKEAGLKVLSSSSGEDWDELSEIPCVHVQIYQKTVSV